MTRKNRIEAAIKANPEKSNRAIADEIGVSREYVGRVRQQSAASDEPAETKKNKQQPSGELEFSATNWMPATEAVTRLTRLLGSPRLARHQLCKDIRRNDGKPLPAASRCILRYGSETFERLKESFDVESWLEANTAEIGDRLDGGVLDDGEYGGPEEQSAHAGSAASTICWLFVDRSWFEKLHPAATPETAASASANNTMPPRKPGQKFKDDWPIVLAQWLLSRLCDPKLLRRTTIAALFVEADAVLQEELGGWSPLERELRDMIVELIRRARKEHPAR
jgi:hypothetical protein